MEIIKAEERRSIKHFDPGHKMTDGNKTQVVDASARSMGIAAQTLMLGAKAMDYNSCPMDGFDFEAVAKINQAV